MVAVKKYKIEAVSTLYWRPRCDYLEAIVVAVKNRIEDGDIVVVSEKAISTALNNIVDENLFKASRTAVFLARFWMRIVWGYVLGIICRLRKQTIQRFRTYPLKEGSIHKQVALIYAGFLQALMHGSEGGIDGSNLPYSYVSLPLCNAQEIAEKIKEKIRLELGKRVGVLIADTDKTYSFRGFHFTPRPCPIKGIRSFGGFISYIVGRFFNLKRRATPIALADADLSVEEALEIADLANKARGVGSGRTVWDMAETFHVSLTKVTWEMLDQVEHKPVVIVKLLNKEVL
ncbi:MAG: coenzyme F420-0:L-glutamate ligase [Candidatus Bathyarchaeia archaeon]